MTDKSERPNLELVQEKDEVAEGMGEFPRTFGNYLLLLPLGQGGMGDVYLAKHGGIAGIEKHCVLKMLRPQFTDDREYVSRFIDEARVVVQLSHKNICHVFDVGNVENRYYLAMEYIAGNDLKSLVWAAEAHGEKLELGIVLHVVNEVLEALDYAHRIADPATGEALQLVHRDVSPQNVMISFEGEVKLIDFGLAASTLKLERTEPNVVMGKVAYMSPEQVRGDVVDGRTDLFAVGVMLYELLAHERYYEGKSPYEIWAHAGTGGFRPRKWDEIDAEIRDVLARALATNRDDRYSTCSEMREALDSIRMKRALRGSTVAVRQLIERSMPEEISESRTRLAKFKNVKLLRTGSAGSAGTLSGSSPRSGSSGTSPTAPAHRAPVENTETMRKEFADVVAPVSRRYALFGAAAAFGALIAAVIVLAIKASSPAPVAAPVVPATVAAPLVAPKEANAIPSTNASTPPNASAPPPATPPATQEPDEANAAAAPATPAPVVKTPAKAKAKSSSSSSSSSAAGANKGSKGWEEISGFKQRCPTMQCSVELSTRLPELGEHINDKEWMHLWSALLKECRASCK